jgi:hypothetical protein
VLRRHRLVLFVVGGAVALTPGTAAADAAGPSDFRSRVVSVEPATDALHLSVEGGDSFLMLHVDAGTRVEVPGYQGEPFLRFEADGAVLENRASLTYAASRSRYGAAGSAVEPDAAPDWHQVSSDGEYAWHDHRIHWMSPNDPPGKVPGDIVLRSQIAMTVNGTDEVVVTVESVWLPAPSPWPAWLGGALGLAVAAATYALRRVRWSRLLLADLATLAMVVGWWQFRSLPPETGPRVMWFALPAVALVAATASFVVRNRLSADALRLLAGANLVVWGWARRDGLVRPVLPTNAPWWLDRVASAAALTGGAMVGVAALVALGTAVVAPQRLTSAS